MTDTASTGGPADPAARAPLAGIRVLDFSRILAGPMATMTLADLGAEVIKIERPGVGDDTRTWGPPWAEDGTATYFQSVNRNKRSIALDLRDPDDIALALELVATADIMVDNFIPGLLERSGLGDDVVRGRNPGLILGRISGFGSDAGLERPGYDFVAQALGGLMHITGEPEGEAMKVGVALVDILCAKDLTIGLLAALRRREATGLGTLVEVNLLSSLQGALANQAQAVIGAGAEPGRLGNAHPSICPYEALACGEGELAVAIGNDTQFRRFTRELGAPELAEDPRFATNPDRVANRDALRPLLEAALASASASEWESRLTDAGLAVGRVATISEGLDLARGLRIDAVIDLERDGVASRGIRHPARYSPEFPMRRLGPPALDADGSAIRRELGTPPPASPTTDRKATT